MPIKSFLSFYRQAVKMEARQFSELADISLISNNMQLTYYKSVKDRYRAIIDPEAVERMPERPQGFVVESGSEDGMRMMKMAALGVKRFYGYGR